MLECAFEMITEIIEKRKEKAIQEEQEYLSFKEKGDKYIDKIVDELISNFKNYYINHPKANFLEPYRFKSEKFGICEYSEYGNEYLIYPVFKRTNSNYVDGRDDYYLFCGHSSKGLISVKNLQDKLNKYCMNLTIRDTDFKTLSYYTHGNGYGYGAFPLISFEVTLNPECLKSIDIG